MRSPVKQLKSCTTQHFPTGTPSQEWTPEQLHVYAQSQHQAILDDERTLALKYWRLGLALSLLRKNFNYGQWEQLLGTLGIEKTKASRARAIARTFTDEAEVAGLTVQEAYERRSLNQPQQSTDSPGHSAEAEKFHRFLDRVAKTADGFIDFAGFAEPHEATELLSALDRSLTKLEQLRGFLRRQSGANRD